MRGGRGGGVEETDIERERGVDSGLQWSDTLTGRPGHTQSCLLPSLTGPILTLHGAPPHNQRHME